MSEFIELTFFLNGHTYITDSSFVPAKSSYISLKLTRLKRTPVNKDNGHFYEYRVTNFHISSTFSLRTMDVCALFMTVTEYLTSENLTETVNEL